MRRAPVITHRDAKSTTCMFVIMTRIDLVFQLSALNGMSSAYVTAEVENRLQKSIWRRSLGFPG